MPTPRRIFPVPVCLAGLALAMGITWTAQAASGGPVLVSGRGTARVELSSGSVVSVPLPRGAELASVSRLGDGWIAAGLTRAQDGAEILLVTDEGEASSILPPPPGRQATIRQEPMPLVAGDRLAGLVWLEGQDRGSFGVRFAPWKGSGWGEVQTISPAGKGSQLALSTAQLRDGSWLVAWSAFDGSDDEILWSRWEPELGEVWSKPRRAAQDNAVPDITPALTAAGDGALLAWSRFDGEGYSTVVSRFRAGKWTPPQPVGPDAALYPTFEAAAEKAGSHWLVLRTAEPRGWSVVELDAAGRPGRKAALVSSETSRPVVTAPAGPSKSVTFRWPATGAERQADWEVAVPTPERRP